MDSRTGCDVGLRVSGFNESSVEGLAMVSMLGCNLSEGRTELMHRLSGENLGRKEKGLLLCEFSKEREQHMFYLPDIHTSPTDGEHQKWSWVRS